MEHPKQKNHRQNRRWFSSSFSCSNTNRHTPAVLPCRIVVVIVVRRGKALFIDKVIQQAQRPPDGIRFQRLRKILFQKSSGFVLHFQHYPLAPLIAAENLVVYMIGNTRFLGRVMVLGQAVKRQGN